MKKIGRLRFLAYLVLVNILFAIPIRIAFDIDQELFMGASVLVLFIYNVFMYVLIEKRARDIGFQGSNASWTAFIWFFVSMWLGFWAIKSSFIEGDQLEILESSASVLLFWIITNAYFLFMPNPETIGSFKESVRLHRTHKNLLKQKQALEHERQIKILQEEIKALQAASSRE